jgi:hypothetical protein
MALQATLAEQPVLPAQVWTRLAVDVRQKTICFMAQLAYNFVAAQADFPVKEAQQCLPTSPPIKSGRNTSTGKP